jgi:hypothetical protein
LKTSLVFIRNQHRRKTSVEVLVGKAENAALRNCPDFCKRYFEKIGSLANRFSVEISPGDSIAVEKERVVCSGIALAVGDSFGELKDVPRGTLNLRRAAQAVCVLNVRARIN